MRNFWLTKDGTGAKIHVYRGSGSSRREIACYYLTNAELDNLRIQLDSLKNDLTFAASKKTEVVKPIFKVGDEVYNRFDKSLRHVVIESVDETTYYGDTTNFNITDQDQWGIVRSCENCQCGHYLGRCKGYDYPTVSCYLHEDCGGDEPIIISDDDFVETAMNCKEFEQEN